MANILPGADADQFTSVGLIYDFLNTLTHSPTVVPGSTTATATWTETIDDGEGGTIELDHIVRFLGTGLNTADGTITSMLYGEDDGGGALHSVTLTDLSIDSSDMLTAISSAGSGDTDPLKAIFQGIDWTVNLSGIANEQTFIFEGTGGDDTVTLGAETDYYGLDGGNDVVDLGAGLDIIYYGNFLNFVGGGYATINGGADADTLILDFGTEESPILSHGMTANLSKKIEFDDFSIQLKSVEDLVGTFFSDTLTGTKGANWITGNGGGDRIIGGGGADDLWGGGAIDDVFTYKKASDSKAGQGHDTIHGFEHGTDFIDLHAIDPGTKNHAFKFVGDNALKNVGDLHVIFLNRPGTQNDVYLVEANLDRDRKAELQIEMEGITNLSKGDFML